MSAPLQVIAAALGSEDQARRVLAALEAAGYVCAPKLPTDEMLRQAWAAAAAENAGEVWREMLDAFASTKWET